MLGFRVEEGKTDFHESWGGKIDFFHLFLESAGPIFLFVLRGSGLLLLADAFTNLGCSYSRPVASPLGLYRLVGILVKFGQPTQYLRRNPGETRVHAITSPPICLYLWLLHRRRLLGQRRRHLRRYLRR